MWTVAPPCGQAVSWEGRPPQEATVTLTQSRPVQRSPLPTTALSAVRVGSVTGAILDTTGQPVASPAALQPWACPVLRLLVEEKQPLP